MVGYRKIRVNFWVRRRGSRDRVSSKGRVVGSFGTRVRLIRKLNSFLPLSLYQLAEWARIHLIPKVESFHYFNEVFRKSCMRGENLRQYSFHIEIVKMEMYSLLWLPVEKVVTLGISRVVSRVVGRCECTVPRLVAVENETARIFVKLTASCYTKICKKKNEKKKNIILFYFRLKIILTSYNTIY